MKILKTKTGQDSCQNSKKPIKRKKRRKKLRERRRNTLLSHHLNNQVKSISNWSLENTFLAKNKRKNVLQKKGPKKNAQNKLKNKLKKIRNLLHQQNLFEISFPFSPFQ